MFRSIIHHNINFHSHTNEWTEIMVDEIKLSHALVEIFLYNKQSFPRNLMFQFLLPLLTTEEIPWLFRSSNQIFFELSTTIIDIVDHLDMVDALSTRHVLTWPTQCRYVTSTIKLNVSTHIPEKHLHACVSQ